MGRGVEVFLEFGWKYFSEVFTCQAPSPRGIALANGKLYWADYNGGTIIMANLDGTGIELVPKPNDPSPTDAPLYIDVLNDKVYWTEPQTDRVRMVRDDGAVFLIATGDNPTFLTLHDGAVWWSSTIEFGQIYRNTTPFGGAPGQQISYPNAIIPDDDYIYLPAGRIPYEPNGTQGVAQSFGATGYYGSSGRFAKDATHTFWIAWSIQNGKHWLLKTPIGGGATIPLAETAYTNQSAVAVDGTHVYYAVETSGQVFKIPKAGGTPTLIASGQNRPWDIAVDGTHVYWSNQGLSNQSFSGSVMAAPK